MHPSELGTGRWPTSSPLSSAGHGIVFDSPSLELDGPVPNRLDNLLWILAEGAPWVGRRIRDLSPFLTRGLLLPGAG